MRAKAIVLTAGRRWRVRHAVCLALTIASMAWPMPASAQQSVDVASISGRVVDESGAVVAGADVSARQTTTNITITTTTDRTGRFRFPYLRVGPYEIVVRQSGFSEAVRTLTVTAGSAFELPITLAVPGVDARVTVTADTVLDAGRSQLATTVSRAEVDDVPLNGRRFLDLALLATAVSPVNAGSGQLFPETSAVPGATLSIASQRNLSNNFIVDGLSANDDAAALSGITYSVDAIEQFQIVTSGGQAELGRALGGYVNVVTRSGTNVLQGTAYEYIRDDQFTAANALSGLRLPMRQWQFGGSAGGPIVRDRTFYFGNVEQQRLHQSGLVVIAPENVAAINARLAAVGYGGSPIVTGVYESPLGSTNLLAKVDHRFSDRHQGSLRYSLYDVHAEHSRGAGGLNAPSASTTLDNRDQSVAVSNTVMLGDRTLLDTRAQVAHGDLQAPPTDPAGPAVSITNVAAFGRLSTSPVARVNTLYQIANTVSHQMGAHALKAGVDLLFNQDRIEFPRAVNGTYTFASLEQFLAGTYNTAGFTQTFGAAAVAQTNANVGVFLQNEWKPAPGITLNAGVRYDLQQLATIHLDADNIAPRVGVAWLPFPSRRFVVRGNAGVFYDRVPLRAVANALLSAGNTTDLAQLRQISITLSPDQALAPHFPATLTGPVPQVTLPSLTTMDRHLQNALSRQAGVEVEQQIGRRVTVSAAYQYVRGDNLLMQINQNVPTCAPAGTNNGCRPVTDYANNNQYSAAGESTYQGLQVSLVHRPSAWGHYRVSYTLSKSMNNVGEFFFSSPIDPADLSRDWGRSDDDQRHRLSFSATVQTPAWTGALWKRVAGGFQISGLVQAYSALPLNITSGVTSIQGTPGRPLVSGPTPSLLDVRTAAFIPRNAGTGNDFFSLGARITRTFRVSTHASLEAIVEGFNLTNRTNALARNGGFGARIYPTDPSPAFGRITAVGEARSGQFGVRVRF